MVADGGGQVSGVSSRTAGISMVRYRADGAAPLAYRSSARRRVPGRTDARHVELIAALRRSPMSGAEIADCLRMTLSTVSGILTNIG